MKPLLTAVLLTALLFLVEPARATIYTVHPDGTGDFATIQDAVAAATDGDVIELTDGTFTGDGNRDIDYLGKAITIRSQGGDPATCVIDCEAVVAVDDHRGFLFQSSEGPGSILQGLTVTRGGYALDGGGAVLILDASPTITGCIFVENNADYGTIGFFTEVPESAPTFTDCAFLRNESYFGAGVGVWGGRPTFINCEFAENYAYNSGGGAYVDWAATAEFVGCTFRDNYARAGGAVILGRPGLGSTATFSSCLFSGNAGVDGSVIFADESTFATIANSTLYGNSSYDSPDTEEAAIWCRGDAVIENTIIALGPVGPSVSCGETGSVSLFCTDIYGNAGGDWVDCIAPQLGVNGNISEDPLFCRPLMGDLHLRAESPCAEENNPACGLIGLLETGCQPQNGSISGSVTLHLEADPSGVKMEAFPDTVAVLTDAAGGYSLTGLYPGTYTIRASKPGWATQEQGPVVLDAGGSVSGIDFVLTPFVGFEECRSPNAPIPDAPDSGPRALRDTLGVSLEGFSVPPTVAEVAVYLEITHPDLRELVVDLQSPDSTRVRIFEGLWQSEINGWYPDELEPVESLDSFIGEPAEGDWILIVADRYQSELVGTLHSWCLRLGFSPDVVAAPAAEFPQTLVLRSSYPNPLITETTLGFDLPFAEDVRLQIFDTLGRRVATLLSGPMPAGSHRVSWHGRDARGLPLPSGVYLYRLEAGDRTLQKKLILLR
jgi:subtilisin-like proprotein convertase family protein